MPNDEGCVYMRRGTGVDFSHSVDHGLQSRKNTIRNDRLQNDPIIAKLSSITSTEIRVHVQMAGTEHTKGGV